MNHSVVEKAFLQLVDFNLAIKKADATIKAACMNSRFSWQAFESVLDYRCNMIEKRRALIELYRIYGITFNEAYSYKL